MRIRKNMLVIFPGDRSEGYNPADIGVTVKKFKKHSWEVVVLGIFLKATPMWSGVYKTFKEEKLIPIVKLSVQELQLPFHEIVQKYRKEMKQVLKRIKFAEGVSVPKIIRELLP